MYQISDVPGQRYSEKGERICSSFFRLFSYFNLSLIWSTTAYTGRFHHAYSPMNINKLKKVIHKRFFIHLSIQHQEGIHEKFFPSNRTNWFVSREKKLIDDLEYTYKQYNDFLRWRIKASKQTLWQQRGASHDCELPSGPAHGRGSSAAAISYYNIGTFCNGSRL